MVYELTDPEPLVPQHCREFTHRFRSFAEAGVLQQSEILIIEGRFCILPLHATEKFADDQPAAAEREQIDRRAGGKTRASAIAFCSRPCVTL